MFKSIGKLVAALNGYQRPGEMAAGMAFGLVLAVMPGGNLLWWLLFFSFSFFKVNKAAMLLAMFAFGLLSSLWDPLLHELGLLILQAHGLYPFFLTLAAMPLLPLTRFNNTLVMGALIASPLVLLAGYFLFLALVRFYRRFVRDRFIKPKLLPWLKRIPVLSHLVRFFEWLSRAGEAVWQ